MTVYWPGGSPDTKLIMNCDRMSRAYYNDNTTIIYSWYILLTSGCINIVICTIAVIGPTNILSTIQLVNEVDKVVVSSLELPLSSSSSLLQNILMLLNRIPPVNINDHLWSLILVNVTFCASPCD